MAYTYTEPASGVFASAVSEVRFLLGDTVPASPFSLTDAQIEYLIAQRSDNRRAAAADAAFKMSNIYTSYSSTTAKSVGNLSLSKSYGDAADRYRGLSAELRRSVDLGSNNAPGLIQYDTDTVTPQFYLGQFDNPEF